MRSIFTQLTFKRRLPKICQYNRMLYLPTIRSQMVTDQTNWGLKWRPLSDNFKKKSFNKILAGRLLAAAPGASRAAAGGRCKRWI